MRKRIMASLAALFLALGLGVGIASPARAAASDCPTDYFCVWILTQYQGGRWQVSKSQLVNAYHNGIHLPTGYTNAGSSFYNHLSGSSWAVNIYDSSNCNVSPWFREMQAGQKASAEGSDWDNRVSSIQLWNASPLTC